MERIRIDDFVDFKFISGLEYNEKGTYACFVVYQGMYRITITKVICGFMMPATINVGS